MSELYEKLKAYAASDMYPMHMPGHKRRQVLIRDPYAVDITEIEGFDNLHHPAGILKDAQDRAAALYGAQQSFFLVNGSTAGILAAIGAAAVSRHTLSGREKEEPLLIMARNSHKSAYHAVYLNRMRTEYIWPEAESAINGPVDPADVERACRMHPDAAAVFVTSPTYDGVVSDIRAIAAAAHRYGIPVIVDEAHGAHFGFHPEYPVSAVTLGADLVIQSLHKMLYSMTQTGLLHVCRGSLLEGTLLQRMLCIYQTSSPSYVLMSSLDECIARMHERGKQDLEEHMQRLKRFYSLTDDLNQLALIRTDDPAKILIGRGKSRLSGLQICDILRDRYHIEAEMASPQYALLLTSPGDDEEGLARLSEAIRELDMELDLHARFPGHPLPGAIGSAVQEQAEEEDAADFHMADLRPEAVMTIAEGWDAGSRTFLLEETSGMISAEFVYLYPPGIPILTPGEQVPPQLPEYLSSLRGMHFELQGMEDPEGRRLRVLTVK